MARLLKTAKKKKAVQVSPEVQKLKKQLAAAKAKNKKSAKELSATARQRDEWRELVSKSQTAIQGLERRSEERERISTMEDRFLRMRLARAVGLDSADDWQEVVFECKRLFEGLGGDLYKDLCRLIGRGMTNVELLEVVSDLIKYRNSHAAKEVEALEAIDAKLKWMCEQAYSFGDGLKFDGLPEVKALFESIKH